MPKPNILGQSHIKLGRKANLNKDNLLFAGNQMMIFFFAEIEMLRLHCLIQGYFPFISNKDGGYAYISNHERIRNVICFYVLKETWDQRFISFNDKYFRIKDQFSFVWGVAVQSTQTFCQTQCTTPKIAFEWPPACFVRELMLPQEANVQILQ